MKKKQIIGICIVAVLIAIYFGVKMYASNIAEKRINFAIAKAVNFVDVDYKKVSVDLLGMDVRISDILVSPTFAKGKLKINEIIIHDIDSKSKIPSFLSVSIKGIELSLKEPWQVVEEIRGLGYTDRLLINFNANYIYEKGKKEFNVKNIGIGVDGAGEINVSFYLGNINLNQKEIFVIPLMFMFGLGTGGGGGSIATQSENDPKGMYPHIILYEAKATYEDASLAERIIKYIAKDYKNINAEGLKMSFIQAIENEIKKEKDDFTKKALVAIKKFIDDPKELSISVSPSKPCPLGRIMRVDDLKDIIKLLNIRIKS